MKALKIGDASTCIVQLCLTQQASTCIAEFPCKLCKASMSAHRTGIPKTWSYSCENVYFMFRSQISKSTFLLKHSEAHGSTVHHDCSSTANSCKLPSLLAAALPYTVYPPAVNLPRVNVSFAMSQISTHCAQKCLQRKSNHALIVRSSQGNSLKGLGFI